MTLHVYATDPGIITLASQQRASCGAEVVENRFAQLRATGGETYQLFWKNGSGRWTACCGTCSEPFTGSIDECLSEIARDPHGCFWS